MIIQATILWASEKLHRSEINNKHLVRQTNLFEKKVFLTITTASLHGLLLFIVGCK